MICVSWVLAVSLFKLYSNLSNSFKFICGNSKFPKYILPFLFLLNVIYKPSISVFLIFMFFSNKSGKPIVVFNVLSSIILG